MNHVKSDRKYVEENLSVPLSDPNFDKKLCKIYRKHGVAVITGVYTSEFCDDCMDDIVTYFEGMGTGVDRNDLKKTWIRENLPPQTRPGMFQTLVGHFQSVWNIRGHKNTRKIFTSIYSDLEGKQIDDFIVSYDGMSIIPNEVGPYNNTKNKDWAHIDQTIRGKPFLCVQGQAVLTDTTAAFRCTPGSCHLLDDVLDLNDIDPKNKNNWCKFGEKEKEVQELCEEKGLDWQRPIYAPKGSFIIWASSTIHSAKFAEKKEEKNKHDPWKGWRGVVYVCYRPRKQIKEFVLKKRKKHVENNRMTSHWGEKLFPMCPGGRFLYIKPRHCEIEGLLKDATLLYNMCGEPKVDLSLV